MLISDQDYGLTADDEVVLQTDPRSVVSLVSRGCRISQEVAEKYGIPKTAKEEESAPSGKANEGPKVETTEVKPKATPKGSGLTIERS